MTVSFRSILQGCCHAGLTFALLLGTVQAAPKPDVPSGWSASQKDDVWTLVPPNLKKDQVFFVQVYPAFALKGNSLEDWARSFVQKASTAMGKIIEPAQFQEESGMLVGSVGVLVQNQPVVLVYGLVESGDDEARVFLMASSPDPALSKAYGKVMPELLASAMKKQGNQTSSGNSSGNTSTTADFSLPAGAKLGGKVEYGIYQCSKVMSDGEKRKYSLSLYDNGEYRIGKDDTGDFKFDAKSGRINIDSSYDLYNSQYEEEDFSIYYRDKNNKPVIYAENDYGLGIWKTTCLYAGKNTQPSPKAEAAEKKQQQEEKERFKYTTAPGKGVQMNQIEALVVHYRNEYNAATMLTLPTPHLALLLKDGTAYLGLRVPPEDLDIKASRKYEPNLWTKWKGKGKSLTLLEKNKWTPFPAEAVLPAQKGEKIKGEFKHMESSYNFAFGGSTFTEFYTFDAKGNFERSSSSLFSTGNMQSINGESLSSSSYSDREGTSGSTGYAGGNINGEGPTVVTNVQKSDKTANPEKEGTYTLNGYTLQMKLGNGKVVRKLFFFFDKKKEDFWIENASFYPSNRYD